MRLRTLAIALAVAAPLVARESAPAAACGWLWGSSYGYAPASYSYSAPRTYGYLGYAPRSYSYGYTPGYYGGYGFYGRRWGWGGWRGYGYRGWRGYGYRGWRGARFGDFRGARVAGFRGGGFRGGFGGGGFRGRR
jgi:hypothetical protein